MSTLTVNTIDEAMRLVSNRLASLGNPLIAYIGQRAADVFMFTPFVNISLVICLDNDETGIPTISLEKMLGKKKLWYSTALGELLNNPLIQEEITNALPKGSLIIPYAGFQGLSEFCQQNGYFLLGADYIIRSMFENKEKLARLKRELKLPNTSVLVRKEEVNYFLLTTMFGKKFVVQSPFGSSGTGTFIINGEADFNLCFDLLSDCVIVSKFHEGLTVSVNFVVTNTQIIQVSPSIQVIGQAELSVSNSTFCGVDYPLFERVTTHESANKVRQVTNKVAKHMQQKGFRGTANINLMLQGLELTDINARFMGSGLLTTLSQLKQGVIPISLIHLMHFLGIDFEIGQEALTSYLSPLESSMIVTHSLVETEKVSLNAPIRRAFFEGSVIDESGRLLPIYQQNEENTDERVCSSSA